MDQNLSEDAQRIAAEKPELWEYRLTLAVLEAEMRPVLRRWDALQRKLYSNGRTRIPRDEFLPWMQDRLAEATDLTESFTTITNQKFDRAWGAPGEPGDVDAIVTTSKLFAEVCSTALAWEEKVRFASVDEVFEPVRLLFVGVLGRFIDEAQKLPTFLSNILKDPDASGTHSLNMVLTLPDEWVSQVTEAMQTASDRIISEM